jgi:hypothetical protein
MANNSYDTLVITFKKVLKKLVINEKKKWRKYNSRKNLSTFAEKHARALVFSASHDTHRSARCIALNISAMSKINEARGKVHRACARVRTCAKLPTYGQSGTYIFVFDYNITLFFFSRVFQVPPVKMADKVVTEHL